MVRFLGEHHEFLVHHEFSGRAASMFAGFKTHSSKKKLLPWHDPKTIYQSASLIKGVIFVDALLVDCLRLG